MIPLQISNENIKYKGCSIKTDLNVLLKSMSRPSKSCFIPSLSVQTHSRQLISFNFYACLSNLMLSFVCY